MHPVILFSLFVWILPLYTAAHQFDQGDISVTLRAVNEYQLETVITTADRLPVLDPDLTSINPWEHHVQTRFQITQSTAQCYFSLKEFSQDKKRGQTYISGTFQCPEKIINLSQQTIYVALFGSHYENPRVTLLAIIGDETSRLHFTKYKRLYPRDVRAEYFSTYTLIANYLWQGITHIIGGTDHVLFLGSLLVSTVSISAGLITMTVFAVAHSITLFLAVYGVVDIDGGIVEPAIAITILLTALMTATAYAAQRESLLDKVRMPIVFILGLVHGLGFGGDLSDIHLPAHTFLTAMLSFTVGIELGQIVIALCLLPLLYLLKKQTDRRVIVILVSCIIACVALYWTVTRLM